MVFYRLNEELGLRSFITKQFRAIFLDLDGVLWDDSGPGSILHNFEVGLTNLQVLSHNFPDYLKFAISNQTFAARNMMNFSEFKSKVEKILTEYCHLGLIHDFIVCYHHPKAANPELRVNCKCRKPSPTSTLNLIQKHQVDPDNSIFIGDRITDLQSGHLAGINKLLLVQNYKNFEENTSYFSPRIESIYFKLLNDLTETSFI